MNTNRKRILNIAFILLCGGIILFLLRAPDETTAKLPKNENHIKFYSIASKKEAEKYCVECHAENKSAPLPEDHPPKYRCLFCHKKAD